MPIALLDARNRSDVVPSIKILVLPVAVPRDVVDLLEFREYSFLEIGGSGLRQPYLTENLPA